MAPTDTLTPILSRERFAQCFNQLIAACAPNGADAVLLRAKMEVYYHALQSRPQWAVEHSAQKLIETETFFPAAAKWIQAADAAVEQKLRENLAGPRMWQLYCESCRDTGWRDHECVQGRRCGRKFCELSEAIDPNHSHPYMAACSCREHNPSYLRDLEKTRAQARERGKIAQNKRGRND